MDQYIDQLNKLRASQMFTDAIPSGLSGSDTRLALHNELEQVRTLNKSMSSLLHAVKCANDNVQQLFESCRAASNMLDIWSQILVESQRVEQILDNAQWHGQGQYEAQIENINRLRIEKQQQLKRQQALQEQTRLAEVNIKQRKEERKALTEERQREKIYGKRRK